MFNLGQFLVGIGVIVSLFIYSQYEQSVIREEYYSKGSQEADDLAKSKALQQNILFFSSVAYIVGLTMLIGELIISQGYPAWVLILVGIIVFVVSIVVAIIMARLKLFDTKPKGVRLFYLTLVIIGWSIHATIAGAIAQAMHIFSG